MEKKVEQVFNDLDGYKRFCIQFGWTYNEADLYDTSKKSYKSYIEFKEGKIWEIDCNAKRSTGANLDDTVAELFNEYGSSIKHVDFRLNTAKVKRDVQKKTRAFLKNPTKKKK